MSRVSRLYAIAESLRAAAPSLVTVAEPARRHGVSTRTVQRDLQELMDSGVPVRWQEGRGGGWTVDATMTLPPVNLTEDEAAALLLAVRAASGAAPLWPAAESAWGKITAALDSAGSTAVHRWHQVIAVRAARPELAAITATVEQAVHELRTVRLRYTGAAGEESDRVVEPTGLLTAGGHWYLVAWCRNRRDDRAFRLDRIAEATLLEEHVPARDLHQALLAAGVPLTGD